MASLDGSEILFGKRQAPKILKSLDEIAGEVNDKIRGRGIARGMVCVQEDMNMQVLTAEKIVCAAYTEKDVQKRLKELEETGAIIKTMWVDIRYMLKQHTLTVGEIGVLSAKTKEAEKQLSDWIKSTKGKHCPGEDPKTC